MPKFPDMNQLLSMAQSMSKQMEEKMAQMVQEGSAGGGMVTVKINGNKQLLEVKIAPEVLAEGDREMLQDLIVAAVNDAVARVDEELKSGMGDLLGGKGFPFAGF